MPGISMNEKAIAIIVAWILGLFLFTANGAGAAATDSGDTDGHAPRWEMAHSRIDLGKVQEGDTLSACFDFRNTGNAPLHIHKVKSGCGCTHVDYPRTLLAGGEATICLSIQSLGSHGRRAFKTAIHSNDPSRPVVLLEAVADIAPLVSLTPDRIFLRGPAGGDELGQTIDIVTRGQAPLTIGIDHHDLGENIGATLTTVEEKRRYRLEIKNRQAGSCSYRGRLLLRTNYPGREKIVVPVFVHLTAPVAAYPSKLTLDMGKCPACRAGRIYSGSLIIRAHDDRPLDIRSIGPGHAGLTHRLETLVPERAYRVIVRYTANDAPPLPAELKIETNRDDRALLLVPLRLND